MRAVRFGGLRFAGLFKSRADFACPDVSHDASVQLSAVLRD